MWASTSPGAAVNVWEDGSVGWASNVAANEQWTFMSDGTIRGIGGQCLDVQWGSSAPGTHVFWYDGANAQNGGIGTIHTKLFSDTTGAGTQIAMDGFFVRATNDDNIVTIMQNTVQNPDGTYSAELDKLDLSGATPTTTKLTDGISYLDVVRPASGSAQIVYSRTADGVYVTAAQ